MEEDVKQVKIKIAVRLGYEIEGVGEAYGKALYSLKNPKGIYPVIGWKKPIELVWGGLPAWEEDMHELINLFDEFGFRFSIHHEKPIGQVRVYVDNKFSTGIPCEDGDYLGAALITLNHVLELIEAAPRENGFIELPWKTPHIK